MDLKRLLKIILLIVFVLITVFGVIGLIANLMEAYANGFDTPTDPLCATLQQQGATDIDCATYSSQLTGSIVGNVITAIIWFWILSRRKKRSTAPSPKSPYEIPTESRKKRQRKSESDFPDFDDGQGSIFS
tara:strand:+ start:1642 stop:2034 length:393 start_codon:yes stop_codon:yes gene_type:complete